MPCKSQAPRPRARNPIPIGRIGESHYVVGCPGSLLRRLPPAPEELNQKPPRNHNRQDPLNLVVRSALDNDGSNCRVVLIMRVYDGDVRGPLSQPEALCDLSCCPKESSRNLLQRSPFAYCPEGPCTRIVYTLPLIQVVPM